MAGQTGDHDLTGMWDGVYAYPAVPGAGPTTPFLADISEVAGRLSGTIIEPHEFRSGTAQATIMGHRAGNVVDFSKTYHGAGEAYDEPVSYTGQLSDDGTLITGHWMMQEWSGPFEMVRQARVEAAEEAREAVGVDIAIGVD
jgi:hypothetical protein